MGKLSVADIVFVAFPFPFPFSDLSHAKLRPALILAYAQRTIGYCAKSPVSRMTTTRLYALMRQIINKGRLNVVSFVRPNKLFTANEVLLHKNVATLTDTSHERVINVILQMLKNGQ